ncbi:hypothetical protein PoB_002573400 [Plakobranchus ocellatus]|uniref:C-type lectin domain-containing protein n=1 Tax=Plakobranchus ocellatus TaxID=259542 RepID=A0AAV3ZXW1_9GAST|nr:hypothetical protein PoB_002573400 [Plakobranchus ocellatus]
MLQVVFNIESLLLMIDLCSFIPEPPTKKMTSKRKPTTKKMTPKRKPTTKKTTPKQKIVAKVPKCSKKTPEKPKKPSHMPCRQGFKAVGTKCYRFIRERTDWHDAALNCGAHGAGLAR